MRGVCVCFFLQLCVMVESKYVFLRRLERVFFFFF